MLGKSGMSIVEVVIESAAKNATAAPIKELPPSNEEPARSTSSPNFVVEVPTAEHRRNALRALTLCQRMMIEKYAILGVRKVFAMGARLATSSGTPDLNRHPIQDPTGALTVALLMLRRNPPKGDCWMEPPTT